MLFNSYEFIFAFLPVTFIGFFAIAKASRLSAAAWLALASVAFYGYWNPRFVVLLLISAAFNYGMGYSISRALAGGHPRQAKTLLVVAVSSDLALLGFYKYLNFFVSTVNYVADANWPDQNIILPLGISFFTFTQIAFIVDVYRGLTKEYNWIHYLLFVTYFPHLIAGPVLHHKQMMPQFDDRRTYIPHADDVAVGLTVFTIGLAKKVLLADNFATYVAMTFDSARDGVQPGLVVAWSGAIGYTFQLYFDFSGYSDMAVGISRMFGIRLPANFNSPYKALNIIDFWRRWHITLSNFLRDYLYIPLGGNRHGKTRRYANLFTTMLLGGLWHGANWTFVAWGGLHGVYLITNHLWTNQFTRESRTELDPLSKGRATTANAIAWLLTMLSVIVAWVFFRSETFAGASRILSGMFTLNPIASVGPASQQLTGLDRFYLLPNGVSIGPGWKFLLMSAVASVIIFLPNANQISTYMDALRGKEKVSWGMVTIDWPAGLALGGLLAACLTLLGHKSVFLYFQF